VAYFNIIIFTILGVALGPLMMLLANHFIRARVDKDSKDSLQSKKNNWILWSLCAGIGFLIIAFLSHTTLSMIEHMTIFLVLMCLSAVDWNIRKIPNELLVSLLVIKIIFIAISGTWALLLDSLIGFVVGWVIFMLPSMLKISIGWGDVKFAAVTGFYIGIIGLFQSMVVMSLVLALYGGYLLITKKGTLKSKVAIGPPLSIGILITLLFPISEMF